MRLDFLERYAKALNVELLEERRESWEGKVLLVILDLAMEQGAEPVLAVKDIAARFRANEGITEERRFSPRRCGQVLKVLRLKTERRFMPAVGGDADSKDRSAKALVWHQDQIQRLCRQYGLQDEFAKRFKDNAIA